MNCSIRELWTTFSDPTGHIQAPNKSKSATTHRVYAAFSDVVTETRLQDFAVQRLVQNQGADYLPPWPPAAPWPPPRGHAHNLLAAQVSEFLKSCAEFLEHKGAFDDPWMPGGIWALPEATAAAAAVVHEESLIWLAQRVGSHLRPRACNNQSECDTQGCECKKYRTLDDALYAKEPPVTGLSILANLTDDDNAIDGGELDRHVLGTLLLMACAHESLTDVVRLVQCGAPVDYFDDDFVFGIGLHCAAGIGNVPLLKLLLQLGSKLEVRDQHGYTALHVAASNNRVDMVRHLLHLGADPAALNGNALTPLHAAAERGSTECAAILLDAGSPLEALTVWGDTPLLLAARGNHTEAVSFLLERGSNASAENDNHETPLFLVRAAGNPDAEALLLKFGAKLGNGGNMTWRMARFWEELIEAKADGLLDNDTLASIEISRLLEGNLSHNTATVAEGRGGQQDAQEDAMADSDGPESRRESRAVESREFRLAKAREELERERDFYLNLQKQVDDAVAYFDLMTGHGEHDIDSKTWDQLTQDKRDMLEMGEAATWLLNADAIWELQRPVNPSQSECQGLGQAMNLPTQPPPTPWEAEVEAIKSGVAAGKPVAAIL
eukprot:CAMPEP_0113704358 /NCGR_PEP_ID=MMETSP0038_2-20120614/26469_1 /TAXON_ID=2898 /ORGANISM="Cryptomonas paramecium" /LENGTH=608 /DNA_ID=CAMNT_0000629119 /DNA_START=479 /DNA_END=2302 /DNA_ORIENTATION=- /assembly_acc=CAM_ASM_000170